MINPMQMILNQMMNSPQIKSNPMAQNAMKMYQSGDTKGLREMAENLCRENGTNPEEVKNRIMNQFGFK